MKKSQILAALALAFALGVVAPVAGVNAAEGDACTTDDGKDGKEDGTGTCVANPVVNPTGPTVEDIKDTATKTELTNAIANASNNTDVAAYKTMQTASTENWTDINETTLMGAINTALDNLYNGNVNGVEKPENYEAAKTLADAIKNAEGISKLIPEYQNLIAAINNTANPVSYDNLVKLAEAAGLKVTLPEGQDKDAKALADAIKGNATYGLYVALNTALVNANEGVKAQGNRIGDLKKALASADDVITAKMIQEAADGKTPVASLTALAKTAIDSDQGEKFIAVLAEIVTAQGVANDAASTPVQYASALKELDKDFKAATGSSLSTGTPVTPEQPDNKPEDNDNNGDKDDSKDPSAPGTGIVGSSEGNAATTVSMVAGLATALTALGAGVVAYRSARRSSEK